MEAAVEKYRDLCYSAASQIVAVFSFGSVL
jgi:hypothetical protein